MYTVLDENLQVIGNLSLNNGRGSTAFFNDSIVQQLATDSASDLTTSTGMNFNDADSNGNTKLWNHTLTVSIEGTELSGKISTRDYIMYLDPYENKHYLLKIISISGDDNSAYRTISAINVSIYELGKKVLHEEKTLISASLKDVVDYVFKDVPFSIYISDDLSKKIDYQITADTTAQAILQDLQAKYDVDVNSWVNLDNSGNINERVIYFGPLGTNNGELIRYGGAKGFENITAEEVSDVVYTKLWINGVTSDSDPKLGHIGSVNNGLEYVVDDDANSSEYSFGASQQQPQYLEGVLTNTLLSQPQALLDWAKDQIKIFNHPRFNYTVTPYHGQMVGLGDTIRVQDFHIKPMILVSSRVLQKTTSFASPETNTFVLGEFTNIFSQANKSNSDMIQLIKKDIIDVTEVADNAKETAKIAQEQAIHAQTSADGKTNSYTADSVSDLPVDANEGDIAWVTIEDGTHGYTFINGQWIEDINPNLKKSIQDGVTTAISTAKADTEKAISDNNASINNTIDQVSQEKVDLAIKDADFNDKAQAMADKALSDAKANTATVAQETLDSANLNIAQAKSDITDAYKTADGVIDKKIDDTASSITTTINQNKSDADGKITTAQSTATQALNEVSTKVSQTDYDTKTGDLDTRVTKAQQTADGAVTTVGNYKTSNDARVKAAETKISQNANDITLRATTTDLNNAKADYNAQIAQVKVDAGKVETTVSNLSDTVNNISIGGRNLLLGTRDWTDNTRWNQRNTVTTDTYRGMVIASSGGAWTSPTYSMQNAGILQVGKTYTFSTYVRNTSDTDTRVAPYYEGDIVTPIGKTQSLPAHTDWIRVSITFQCIKDPTTSTANLRWEGQNGLTNGFIQFAGYKLEEGNKATDWSPAPEDTVNALASQQVTIDGITDTVSKQGTNIDSVTKRVTTAEGTLTTATNNITGLQTKQTTTANQVTQEIADRKTGDSNTLQSSKDFTTSSITNYDKGIQSQMTQTASGILAQVSSTNLFPNSEFESDYGYESLSGNTKLSLAYKWVVGSNQNGVVEIRTTANSYQGYLAEKIAVFGGSRISFSTLLHYENGGLASGQAGVDMRFRDRDGNETGKQLKYLPQQSDYWTTIAMENIYVPDNSVSLSITLIVNDAGAGQYAVFTQPMLVNSSTVKKYTPNTGITDSLSLLKDNWSIGIADNVGGIVSGIVGNASQMSLISKKVVIDSPSTQITGTAWINSAMIQNGAIGTAQIGDAVITSAKIANLDVSKLTGDTITGFNFNVNKSMNIASGGVIKSDVINMDKSSFILNTSTVATDTVTTVANNKMTLSNINYSIDSTKGAILSSGTVNLSRTNGSTSNANFDFRIAPDYFSMSSKNWSDGVNDNYMTMTDYSVAFLAGSPLIDKASSYSSVSQDGISTTGAVTSGNIKINGNHAIQMLDGADLYFSSNSGAGDIDLRANSYRAKYIKIGGNHVLYMMDYNDFWLSNPDGNPVGMHGKAWYNSSLVSLKEHISNVDPEYALAETLKADVRQYNFIGDDITDRHVSPMIDDVDHELYIPNDWVDSTGKGVDTYTITGYLIQSVKALQQEIEQLKQA